MTLKTISLGKLKFNWRGQWASETSYTRDDVVQHNGSGYVCIISHTSTVFVDDVAQPYWNLMVARGDVGPMGPSGTISGASDVDISNLEDGSLLIYDDSINKWIASRDLDQQSMDGGFY